MKDLITSMGSVNSSVGTVQTYLTVLLPCVVMRESFLKASKRGWHAQGRDIVAPPQGRQTRTNMPAIWPRLSTTTPDREQLLFMGLCKAWLANYTLQQWTVDHNPEPMSCRNHTKHPHEDSTASNIAPNSEDTEKWEFPLVPSTRKMTIAARALNEQWVPPP